MIICFLGPEGSGKGTQADLLAKQLHVPHVIASDALRKVMAQDSPLGREIYTIMHSGQYVSDDKIITIYLDRIARADCAKGFIADGYPRSVAQAQALDDYLDTQKKKIDYVFLLTIPEEETLKRLQARGRYDDTPENIKGRLQNYHARADRTIAYYRSKNVLLEINAHRPIEDIHTEIMEIVNHHEHSH